MTFQNNFVVFMWALNYVHLLAKKTDLTSSRIIGIIVKSKVH